MSRREVTPQQGPQERFMNTGADIAVYGGAAGGGKSFALLMDAMRWFNVPGYEAVVFRRTMPEIRAGDGLWAKSEELYRGGGSVGREHTLEWKWPSGARVAFRHMQHTKDRFQYQGAAYAFIGFDELTHFEPSQFWYLASRNRSSCGVRPYIRATCNPDPDSFVRQLVDWYVDRQTGLPIQSRSGVVRWFVRRGGDSLVWSDSQDGFAPGENPLSFTFISARLSDNPALTERDPSYQHKLESLPLVERSRLLGGNWNIRPSAGLYFRRDWFEVIDRPPEKMVMMVRSWDKAATQASVTSPDPDWTAGVKLGVTDTGKIIILDVTRMRGTPRAVEEKIRQTAERDGAQVTIAMWQDPGQAGVVDIDHFRRNVLHQFHTVATKAVHDKVTYAGPVSSQAEARNIAVVRAPWNDEFFQEAEMFPDGKHDDMVDALSGAYLQIADRPRYEYHRVERSGPFTRAKGML